MERTSNSKTRLQHIRMQCHIVSDEGSPLSAWAASQAVVAATVVMLLNVSCQHCEDIMKTKKDSMKLAGCDRHIDHWYWENTAPPQSLGLTLIELLQYTHDTCYDLPPHTAQCYPRSSSQPPTTTIQAPLPTSAHVFVSRTHRHACLESWVLAQPLHCLTALNAATDSIVAGAQVVGNLNGLVSTNLKQQGSSTECALRNVDSGNHGY